MDLGKGIKKLRKLRGLTQEDLSTLSGVDAAYISQIETGRKAPLRKTFIKLCKGLDVSYLTLTYFSKSVEDLPDYKGSKLIIDLIDMLWVKLLTKL